MPMTTLNISSLQERWGPDLVWPCIYQGTGVSQALSEGVPVYDGGTTKNVGNHGIRAQYIELTKSSNQASYTACRRVRAPG